MINHPNVTKLVRIGTSKGFVIPKSILMQLGIERGDYITFAVFQGGIFTCRKLTDAEIDFLKPKQILMD